MAKGKPVGSALQNRLAALPLSLGNELERAEFDRRQMVSVVRVGEPVDVRLPTGSHHGDAQVIKRSAAAEDRFSAGGVGDLHPPMRIDEELQDPGLGYPPPRLAVVH